MPPEVVRPERCTFCGGTVESLYVIEVTPTHGARFVEVDDWLHCSKGGVLAPSQSEPGKWVSVHPPGVLPASREPA